jgi:UrcA family protein
MFARKLSVLAAASAALAGALATPAAAQATEDQSVVVRFADPDLDNPAGMARLDTRLKTAAFSVCNSGARDARTLRQDAECRARALAGARTELAALGKGLGGRTQVALRR